MGHTRDIDFLTEPEPTATPKRLAHEVVERIVAELPEDCELYRVAKHVLDNLSYKAPEIAWDYASGVMADALYGAEQLSPRPEWFERVVAIWLGTESTVAS